MRFRYKGQNQITIRSEVNIDPTNSVSESVTNQNATVAKIVTLRPYAIGATFEDSDVDGNPVDWDDVVQQSEIDATLIEDYPNVGRIHTWTAGHFVGEVAINEINGEVTGLRFEAATYQRSS